MIQAAIPGADHRLHFPILALLFIAVNGMQFYRYGLVLMYDSHEYLRIAEDFAHGVFPDVHYRWYFGYIAYLWLVRLADGGFGVVILGQYIFSALGFWAFFQASVNLWGNRQTAFHSALLFLAFIDIWMWNSFVLAESLFISFTCVSIYLLSRLMRSDSGRWNYLLAVIAIIYTFSIKPTGIALVGACVSMALLWLNGKFKSRFPALIGSVVIGMFFLWLVNTMLVTYDIMDNYHKGELIFGISELPDREHHGLLFVTPPDSLYEPHMALPPLLKIGGFIVHHPWYWAKLFIGKLLLHLGHVRPYWSVWHNMLSLMLLLPAYYFFGRYAFRSGPKNKIVLFSLTYFLIHTLSVCLTSVDWDGRFLLPMLPVLFVVAGNGFTSLTNTFR